MRFWLFLFFVSSNIAFAQLPKGFVYLSNIDSSIQLDLRYCTHNNFVGNIVNGYNAQVCIVTLQTALALENIQLKLKKQGLGLKIFDAYRPQQAVNHFATWAKQVNDTLMKQQFYPNVAKKDLFKLEYIASKSRHSSGSTVDVTLVNLKTGKDLDMGSTYDFFGEQSWVNYTHLTAQQKENRQLLQKVMLENGFRNYPKEWWHFTLKNEPFKNQYFNFPVE